MSADRGPMMNGSTQTPRKRLLTMALALSLFAVPLIPGPLTAEPEQPDAEGLYRLGLYQEIGLGNLQQAIMTYNRLISGSPGSLELVGEALVRKGICFEKLNRNEAALACYNRAIEEFSDSASILERAFAGRLRFHAKTKPPVVKMAEPLIDREKELANLLSAGRKHVRRGELTKAKERYLDALTIKPNDHELQLRMASLCERLKQYTQAAVYYNLVMNSKEYKTDFVAHIRFAECYKKAQDYDSAIKMWTEFLSNDGTTAPDREAAEFERELLYEESDYPQKKLIPFPLKAYLEKGGELTRKGDYSGAARVYRTARSKFPRNYLPPLRLAHIHQRHRSYPLGKENLEKLRRHFGTTYSSNGATQARVTVINYLDSLKTAPPATAQRIRCRLAELYEKMGDLANAEYYINQYFAKDLRPVDDDQQIRLRIRQARTWERVKKMKGS